MGLFTFLQDYLAFAAFFFRLGCIHLARFYEPALRKKGKYNHTIVVLGDDHAFGVGDYGTFTAGTGLAQKLDKELAKETSIRQTWQIYNRGEYKTSSEDWLLPADSKRKQKPTLLPKLFKDPKYLKAEIIIIMLGSNDVLEASLSPEDTLRNIELICQALRKSGNQEKSIYLCTIPTAGNDSQLSEKQIADTVARNRLLENYTKENNENVLPGLQIDLASNYEFRRKNLYWHNGRYFSSIGYTKMAKDWVPMIRPDMVKREFTLFRSDLGL